jgi:hypothetical protein
VEKETSTEPGQKGAGPSSEAVLTHPKNATDPRERQGTFDRFLEKTYYDFQAGSYYDA